MVASRDPKADNDKIKQSPEHGLFLHLDCEQPINERRMSNDQTWGSIPVHKLVPVGERDLFVKQRPGFVLEENLTWSARLGTGEWDGVGRRKRSGHFGKPPKAKVLG